MPIKNLLHRFQPAPLYIVLILSICYFTVQLILSHFSHALTLLMASYHMLCNIFALAGSITTIKHNELHNENEKFFSEARMQLAPSVSSIENKEAVAVETKTTDNGAIQKDTAVVQLPEEEARLAEFKRRELKTRNTFGWARIEILTMLIVCITLASLSFSLLVEALQTLIHIDHQDSMHYPVHVMIVGFVGLLLNGFTYLLIGGYTLHQGNFLHINPKGNVVVEPSNICVEGNSLANGNANHNAADLQLKEDMKSELGKVHYRTRREGPEEFLRDISSTIFVIVCAVIVYFAVDKNHTSKFIDPVLSIFSCVLVVALSYPYMKESCLILLQTIPGSIDMENFERTLVTKFPQIVSYHDLHIWQLSSHKFIATVHIIFQNPKLYEKTIEDVRSHFQEYRINQVTIQPEFQNPMASITSGSTAASSECLMQCQNSDCMDKVCCMDSFTDLREVSVCGTVEGGEKKSSKKHHHHHHHGHGHGHDHEHGPEHSHDHEHDHEHGHTHGHGAHAHTHHKHESKSKHKHAKSHKCSKLEHEKEDKIKITQPNVREQETETRKTIAVTKEQKDQTEVFNKNDKQLENTKENKNEYELSTNKSDDEEFELVSDSIRSEESQDLTCESKPTEKTETSVNQATMASSKESVTTSKQNDKEPSTSDSNNTKC